MYKAGDFFIIRKKPAREIKCFHLIQIFPFIMTQCPKAGLINTIYFHSNIVHLFKYWHIVNLRIHLRRDVQI